MYVSFLPILCLVAQSCLTLCKPIDCSPPGACVHGIPQARTVEWLAMPSSRGSSPPRDGTQVSRSAGGFLTISEPPGKPVNIGVGCHSFPQWIFPTHESNQGLLRCRWILYQLTYQTKPHIYLYVNLIMYVCVHIYFKHLCLHVSMHVSVCIYTSHIHVCVYMINTETHMYIHTY